MAGVLGLLGFDALIPWLSISPNDASPKDGASPTGANPRDDANNPSDANPSRRNAPNGTSRPP